MERRNDRVTVAAFLVGAALAGGNAVAVRFSNRGLDPLWGAGLRFALAAAIFLGVVLVLGLSLPRGRALAGVVLWGLIQFAATFALMYYAFIELHAGFGQILLALVPLLTALLAAAQGEERLRLLSLVGALMAVVGVTIMTSASLEESVPILSVLAGLGGAVCFAESAVLVRVLPPVHPVTMNAVGMSAGAGALLLGAALIGESFVLPDDASTWAALVYLVTLGSVGVFLLYVFVLGRWTASRVAYSFLLSPIVSILLSAWLDDEPVGWGLVLGGLLVLGGVYIGALRAPSDPSQR
ncbi:MAG TPA: DMT family transporter [Gaiellaceae bacterium]|nr:DMT family transporter [Gaiellaceae bacterium]